MTSYEFDPHELQRCVDDQLDAWLDKVAKRGAQLSDTNDLGVLLLGQLRLLELRLHGIEASLDAMNQ